MIMADPEAVFECGVCYEYLPHTELRTFHCGHGYCQSCVGHFKRKAGKLEVRECAECRQWSEVRPCRVNFTIRPPEDEEGAAAVQRVMGDEEFAPELSGARERSRAIIHNVKKMGPETATEYVVRADKKARTVAAELENQGHDIQTSLVHVLTQFRKQTIKLFKDRDDLKTAQEEKKVLSKEIAQLRQSAADDRRQRDSLNRQLEEVRDEAARNHIVAGTALKEAGRALQETQDTRDQLKGLTALKKDFDQQKEELSTWKGRAARKHSRLQLAENEIRILKAKLAEALQSAGPVQQEDSVAAKDATRGHNSFERSIHETPADPEESQSLLVIDLDEDTDCEEVVPRSAKTNVSHNPWERRVRMPPQTQDISPTRPKFHSNWNLPSDRVPGTKSIGLKRKASEPSQSQLLPFLVGTKAKPARPRTTGPIKRKKVSG